MKGTKMQPGKETQRGERGDKPRERHRDTKRERAPERERGDKPRERHREAERERERVRDRPRDGEE